MVKHGLAGQLLVVVALAGLVPAGLWADRLAMRDGSIIETKGAWKVKGNVIVFTRSDGRLASLKVADVDLDKSSALTAEAQKPAPVEPAKTPAKRPIVLRLEDKDVGHAETATEQATPPESGATDGATTAPAGGLVVREWDRANEDNGLAITGSLENTSKNTAAAINLEVRLYDAEGKLIQSGNASLGSTSLPPGQRTTFNCSFPSVFNFFAAKFEIKSTSLETTQPPASSSGS